ncbi:MAG TPA: type II toxin-antitoxin system Phd/YefM family antitoxin [Thermoanaerobaculia bacterium]|nr:type II toxin-antitoxin system Phd/YefM family antitoxin [Thermoanaerobaculia bacterium]
MTKLNVHEAKTHLSRYLSRIEAGETILLCRHNVPIAEIRPLPTTNRQVPELGFAKGQFEVGPEFFEPLPEWLLDAFEGKEE